MRIGLKTLIVFLLLFCVSCGKRKNEVRYLSVTNNSEERITMKYSLQFPDTNFTLGKGTELRSLGSFNPGETDNVISKNGWDYMISEHGKGYLMIFVFDSKVFSQYPDSIIVQNYMILERRDLSLDDLNALSWTITYP